MPQNIPQFNARFLHAAVDPVAVSPLRRLRSNAIASIWIGL
jgi:hypothetical protein